MNKLIEIPRSFTWKDYSESSIYQWKPRKSGVTAIILSAIHDNVSSNHTIEWFN